MYIISIELLVKGANLKNIAIVLFLFKKYCLSIMK